MTWTEIGAAVGFLIGAYETVGGRGGELAERLEMAIAGGFGLAGGDQGLGCELPDGFEQVIAILVFLVDDDGALDEAAGKVHDVGLVESAF